MGHEPNKTEILELIAETNKEIGAAGNKPDLLHKRAQLYSKIQENTKAINDYIAILESCPSDKEAQVKLNMLQTIVKYVNTDIYASTNTNLDPWME